MDLKHAEIIANGLVQGVGFRYFVYRNAKEIGLNGFVRNLATGEVLTVVEGSIHLIEELFNRIKIGPSHAYVKNCTIVWNKIENEFKNFEIR
ncbi:MAG: acylphosphatase [Ignavibacteriales bacterium CG_4_9_14_3_um_filter_30_11]|nr:MAG: acylphosphatase [Ignavibacteriales bacterium CG_4_9_14_3_um_filter_30_11]